MERKSFSNSRSKRAGSWLVCAMFALPMAVHAQSIDLVVSNPTPVQRVQVVEVDAKKVYQRLGRAYGSPLIVRNVFKQQVVYQLTADSLLLVEAAVSPQRKAVFHITCGMPRAFQSAVDGRLYPWRVDDFAWENDRCAYRAYGPALQQTGEKAFGFDVWLKSVPGLVVAERYAKVYEANQEEKRLRSLGKQQEADSISLNNSLHRDHGNGLDCYKVGPTLGCGAPALMIGDSIVMPYCFKEYHVRDNGPLRFSAEFIYLPVNVNGENGLIEHRLITLDKGSSFNRITVWYENLRHRQKFCAGFVVHGAGKETVRLGNDYVQYADPTDNPDGHNLQIYVGVLFPNVKSRPRMLQNTRLCKGVSGHAVCETTINPHERITYYFGAGWPGSGIRDQKAWQHEIEYFCSALKEPLKINLK